MNKVLLAAVASTLVALPVRSHGAGHAGRHVMVAHVNAPSHSSSGSGAGASSAGAGVYWGSAPLQVAAHPAFSGATQALAGSFGSSSRSLSSRAFFGSGAEHNINAGSFWGRRIDPPTPANSGTGGTGNGLPSVIMAGQLIRTAGLGAIMSQPDTPQSTFAVEAGKIAYEDSKGYALTTHQGVFIGPKDTPPPANPLFGGGSAGGNAITENNNTVTNNSHSNNGNGNGTGGGNVGSGGN